MTVAPPETDRFRPLADALMRAAQLVRSLGRDDLAQRLTIAVARVTRPTTVICVVGEFKQGKSSLVNAMLGESVCPVDDDLATSALTLVRYGPEWGVDVRRRVDNVDIVEAADVSQLREWVSEAGNPGNSKGVERVDVSLPNRALAGGLVLVDTPGMGSLGAGHAAATLAFLPFADALIFVSDASQELTAPEVAFLDRASDLCPNVLFALTKTDLYGEWRRVASINRAHLEATSALDPIPVSSQLRTTALARGDADLNARSGFPALFTALYDGAITPAKELATRRATAEATAALDQLRSTLQAELDALADPSAGLAAAAAAQEAVAQLEHLRGPGARWNVLVGDRLTDLTSDVNFRFRGAMRQCSRDLETQIEDLKNAQQWDDMGRALQTRVAEAVTEAFVAIEAGAQSIRAEVVELLATTADGLILSAARSQPIDVRSLWLHKDLDPHTSRSARALGNTLTGIRGAQSGIMMFGMMARFMPAGIGAVLMMNPVTIGLGAAFGGMQLLDAHKRKVSLRRQQARTSVRQFSEDVQFEVGNAIAEALRSLQRDIRDEFAERTNELQRTYADAARQAGEAVQRDAAGNQRRTAEVTVGLSSLSAAQQDLRAALERVEASRRPA